MFWGKGEFTSTSPDHLLETLKPVECYLVLISIGAKRQSLCEANLVLDYRCEANIEITLFTPT